jgi:hypothetical protein
MNHRGTAWALELYISSLIARRRRGSPRPGLVANVHDKISATTPVPMVKLRNLEVNAVQDRLTRAGSPYNRLAV